LIRAYLRQKHNKPEFLPWSAKTWTLWLPAKVETLQQLLESKATQEEISAALPNRNWLAIRIKTYEIVDKRLFYISPKPIRDEETYADYLERMEQTGCQHPRKSGSRYCECPCRYGYSQLDSHPLGLSLRHLTFCCPN
jgi:hypothetical protein